MASSLPSPIDLSPSTERDDYVRLARLIICGGTTVLTALFDTYHPPADLAKNLNHWKTHLETYARLTEPQKQILYPGSGDPVSKNFDLSLLYKLLRNICGLTEPACKWNGRPLNGDTSTQDDIVRLRNCRNEIYGHVLEDMAISWDEFNKHWEDISKALNRINNAIPNKINPRDLDEKMSKLKFGPLTQDEKYDILHEIQETLNEHTEALSRIEKQGDEMGKRMECLEDTVIQTAIQQSQSPKSDHVTMTTTTKRDNNKKIINSVTNIFNFSENVIGNHPKILNDLCNLSNSDQNAVRELPAFSRSQSFSTSSNLLQQSTTPQDERRLSLHSQKAEPCLPSDRFTQDTSSLSWDFEETILSDRQANQSSWRSEDKAQESPQSQTSPGYHGNVTIGDWVFPKELPRDDQRNESVHLKGSSPVFNSLNATAKPFETKTSPNTNQFQSKNKTNQSGIQGSEPIDLSMPQKTSYSPLVDDGSIARRGSSNFEEIKESRTPQTDSFERYNQIGRHGDQALSLEDLQLQEVERSDGRILHINIRLCEKRNTGSFNLGKLISESLNNCYDTQFQSYFSESRKLKIKEVNCQDAMNCTIGVFADNLLSLEDIWRDCMTNDLREIIKETALPPNFDGTLKVTIDGKEYEQCCKRLTPKDLGEQRSCHSQSYSLDQSQEEDDFSLKSQSLGELPSSSKRAWKKNMDKGNVDIQARLDFCSKSERECNLNCPNLHLCRYHLLEGCTFPENCKNSHDITDNHTNRIFRNANLSSLTEGERSNLLKSLAYTVPEICRFYNMGKNSTCTKNDQCMYLHVCMHWVKNNCVFSKLNKKCNRAHTFADPTTRNILRESNLHELSEDEIKEKLMKHII